VGTTASDAVLSVRIVAEGDSPGEAERLAEADAGEVRRRLGAVVFGEDDETLQSAVARLLVQQGKTVSTAESCTGGLLAERLTEIPGSSAYFLQGFVTYSDAAKLKELGVEGELIRRHGAVSEQVAAAMATGCRTVAGSDFALSITGIAGPSGGSPEKPVGLVYIGLADAGGVEVKRFTFGDHLSRREIRDRSAKAALNMLRLRLAPSG
jgi:nicotinamide-nucleotide amidase